MLAGVELDHWRIDLTITKPLSMNDSPGMTRGARMARARAVKDLRAETKLLARAAGVPRCQRVRVTLVYEPRDARRRDPLNLVPTLKAVQDGLVDAHVVPDDTVMYLESPMPIIDAPIGGRHGRLWVLVERLI